jgi:hypothetical protein
MKYGDIILFKPTTLLGKIISLIDGSPYSHIGVFIEYRNGIALFIESHEKKGGVVITQLQEWENYIVKKPLIKPRLKKDVLAKLGTKYDFSMLVWLLKAKILKKKQYNNNDSTLICSELADYVFNYKVGSGYVATPRTFSESKLFI